MNPGYPPYPPQQTSAPGQYPIYPPTTQPGVTMPSPYPSQPGFSTGYPPAQPGYQAQSSYPPQPGSGYPPQPVTGYPPQPGYPPASTPSYPASSTPSYPQQQGYASAYPPPNANAGVPSYPSQPAASYPLQTSSYPTQNYGNPTYPGQTYPQRNTAQPSYPHSGVPISSAGYGSGAALSDKPMPTVIPASPFDPRVDAEILRRAMKGFGTDEKAIINVVTKRSNRQRLEIAANFKAMYGKDLISDLKSELSGKFEDLIVALMTPLHKYLASEVRHAIEGMGTNEETLVEILCTASNAEINAIKDAYIRLYGQSMENDLRSDTSGHFKRLLVSVVQGRRSENYAIDEAAAARDAQALMAAGVLMIGTDESTFNAILCTRSYPHLRRVIMEYQRLSGKPLDHAIRNEFSGDIEKGLLAIIHSVEDKPGFFAERIRDAVACAGTKDRQLIRVVVSRCEIDMQSIKRAYQQRYGKSMEQAINDDTSGDYKKALLALIGGY